MLIIDVVDARFGRIGRGIGRALFGSRGRIDRDAFRHGNRGVQSGYGPPVKLLPTNPPGDVSHGVFSSRGSTSHESFGEGTSIGRGRMWLRRPTGNEWNRRIGTVFGVRAGQGCQIS